MAVSICKRNCPTRAARTGFTLIELLVVIGIIALLLTILLPSISRARRQAGTVNCLSVQHNLMLATLAYALDNHDFLPFTGWTTPKAKNWCYDFNFPMTGNQQ